MYSQPWSCKSRCPSPYLHTNKKGDHIYSFRISKSLILYFSCCYFIACVKVVHTLICPFWQGSEQTDWMTSLLLRQISRSFICRPPWSQLPTWMYAYSSSPMSLKFMISYLRVKARAFTPQQPPSLDHFPLTCQANLHSGRSEWSPPIRRWSSSSWGTPTVCVRRWDALPHTNPAVTQKSVLHTCSVSTQTHANVIPCILDRGPPAWHVDHKPWSKWHWWRSPSWCPVRTDGAETLSLWRKCTCLLAASHLSLWLGGTSHRWH